jgi:hypothetical protein
LSYGGRDGGQEECKELKKNIFRHRMERGKRMKHGITRMMNEVAP